VKLLIKNGRVIDPGQNIDDAMDVLVQDGRIAEVGRGLSAGDAQLIDAAGLVVSPGFIDMHVHLREPGNEHAETIESGARAAAAGGFTSICAMPNTDPINDNAAVTQFVVESARRAAVRVFPIGAISHRSQGERLAEIGAMRQAGIVAVSDDGRPVMNSRLMRHAMEYSLAFGLPVIDHCEDLHLSAGGQMHEGEVSARLGLRGISGASEDVMVSRNVLLAADIGAQVHIAHISTARAVEAVRRARAAGVRVSCEATPHHFTLSDDAVGNYDTHAKMKPPLRSRADVEGVLDGLADGTVDVIATDHAPHAGSEKMQEFELAPFGIIGLETALALALERLYHTGRVTLNRLVELFSRNPARLLGFEGNDGRPSGTLVPGALADITVFSTERRWCYDANASCSKSRNTPFDGRQFQGGPEVTIVGGKIVWRRA
jgi:dihydroorotase